MPTDRRMAVRLALAVLIGVWLCACLHLTLPAFEGSVAVKLKRLTP